MLKRLQLVGFKSFADRTDFDFSPGVTAVVGPNGSGKSNVVDAVKWVLGEQSAKSLRGSEMSDVIFNGSASRRSLGLAEVTLTFDNARRQLNSDQEELQITRRVYRSGEGEYLINNQLSRLKDIKDLFLGSGAGTDAYCIIEQGRVDVLLQASTKERRTIFEEAAGISRFRARKTETLRKLERVDANLLRLKDITDEVEKQLRSVRLQASKAQRYREHSDRLRELRIGLGLLEYDGLARQLSEATATLETLRRELQQDQEQSEGREQRLREINQQVSGLDENIRHQEARQSEAQQGIAADTAFLGNETASTTRQEADLERISGQVIELTRLAQTGTETVVAAGRELEEVETARAAGQQHLQELDAELDETKALLGHLQHQLNLDKAEHLEKVREAGNLQNEATSIQSELERALRARDQARHRSDQATGTLAEVDRVLQELTAAKEEQKNRLEAARLALAESQQARDGFHTNREEVRAALSELRARRSGLASRVEVLEGLERSHEGLNTGVREVFTLLERDGEEPWGGVLGMVADFLTVRREYAPLLDLALGEKSHHFLVRDPRQLDDALARRNEPFSGRVSFLPLVASGANSPPTIQMRRPQSPERQPEHSGIVARADQLVTCEAPELAELPGRLFSQTLIVRDLETAYSLATHATGLRFVTLQGELLEADGTLTLGTHHAETGLLSRKSELRELRERVAELEDRITGLDNDLLDLTRRIAHAETEVKDRQQELEILTGQSADLASRLAQQEQRREGLYEQVELDRSELDHLEREIQRLETRWQHARDQASASSQRVQQLQARIRETDDEVQRLEETHQHQLDASTKAMVEVARVGERLGVLRERVNQLEAEQRRRDQQRDEAESNLTSLRQRLEDSRRKMLTTASSLAVRCLEKEDAERALAGLRRERDSLRQEQQVWAEQVKAQQKSWQARSDEVHQRDLKVSNLRHQVDTLVGRLREDYQIDLAELHAQQASGGRQPPECEDSGGIRSPLTPEVNGEGTSPECEDSDGSRSLLASIEPAAAAEEIEELKKKLTRLGSVNMDALQELEELEMRSTTLQTQLDDLSAAKKSLEEIINRINTDSRRLFADTLTVIRGHFQELFRKLFGGGQADIVLEDENDILETGIEIIARPPGKELRSISLMSGGEKTLTAVALLLAIFRSKPSPFCILDEVDAALDEANIGRLGAVIREFLDQSQFIMVTHSKRTMASADVLYGVTMQESGISKRIAVRFEDWPDDERDTQDTSKQGVA